MTETSACGAAAITNEARAAAVRAQLAPLTEPELRAFLAGQNAAAIELSLAEFLADLAAQAERDGR